MFFNLFKKMGTGVSDFFYEPMAALARGPDEFKEGLHRGAISFHDNVVVSVGDSMHKMSGAIAKGLAELTGDKDYLEERSMTRSAAVSRAKAQQSKTVGEGFIAGVDTVGSGFARGVGSLLSAPVKGAQKDGAAGFLKGLGKGVVGALVKPAVGVADAAAREHR